MSGVSPGWYPDPAAPETKRYWDGEQWLGTAVPVDQDVDESAPPTLELSKEDTESGDESNPWSAPSLPKYPKVPTHFPPAGSNETPFGPPPPQFPGESKGTAPWSSPGLPEPTPATPEGVHIASPGTRLLARIIDGFVLFALNVLANGWFFVQLMDKVTAVAADAGADPNDLSAAMEIAANPEVSTLWLLIQVIGIALWLAYEVPMTANNGQTLGKRLVGIKVLRADGQPLTTGQSLRRWAIMGLPSLIGGFGFAFLAVDAAWCLWDRPNRQCLHDKIARTTVVTAPANSESNTPVQSGRQ